MSRTITFTKPWGERSWLVEYSGPYSNSRHPHVEVVDYTPISGQTCLLRNLRVISCKALAWDVENVTNKGERAHFTVYFGENPESKLAEHL